MPRGTGCLKGLCEGSGVNHWVTPDVQPVLLLSSAFSSKGQIAAPSAGASVTKTAISACGAEVLAVEGCRLARKSEACPVATALCFIKCPVCWHQEKFVSSDMPRRLGHSACSRAEARFQWP